MVRRHIPFGLGGRPWSIHRLEVDWSLAVTAALTPYPVYEVAQPAPTVSEEAAKETKSLIALKLPRHWFAGP